MNTNNERSRIIIRELTVQIREAEREERATTTRTRGNTRTNLRTNRTRDEEDTEQSDRPMTIEEEADKYDPNTQAELDLWLEADVMNYNSTMSFAETINEQIREEFRSIRQIAAEENAEKTMAAIDGILLARQERLNELREQLETARVRAEETTDETRTTRGRGRMDQGTDSESGGRRSRR